MARTKKKQSLRKSLRYEIYGILLITCAMMTLAGGATFGRSLSKLCGLLIGKWYFFIPLVLIYFGLSVMIKRCWSLKWNSRKSGVVLIIIALALMSTIHVVEQRIMPMVPEVKASYVLSEIHHMLNIELLQATDSGTAGTMLKKDISGGYVGALCYYVLFLLFGTVGIKLITIVILLIGFMLITQLSYIELIQMLRKQIRIWITIIQKKRKALVNEQKCKQQQQHIQEGNSEAVTKEQPTMHFIFSIAKQLVSKIKQRIAKHTLFIDELSTQDEVRGQVSDEVSFGSDQDHLEYVDSFSPNDQPIPLFRDFTMQQGKSALTDQDDTDHLSSTVTTKEEDLSTIVVAQDNESHNQRIHTAETEKTGEALQPPPNVKPYQLPPFHLLEQHISGGKGSGQADFIQTARKLEATLESFGVRAKVLEVVRGPAVTRYEIQPDIGVKVSRIVNLSDDIALALAAKDVRMEAPIPGKSAIGIEVPNHEVSVVTMREVMETLLFIDAASPLSITLGRDIAGIPIIGNLMRMPHLLVAGATGSGKSVCINAMITSILYKAKPNEVKFLMVDPKMVELNVYNGIPHLLAPVVTDPRRASLALKKIVVEMEKRYELFSKSTTRNIEGYNKLVIDEPELVLPYIVVIVDELADLMMVAANDVEDAICRLAQMARAAGIHLIIATQRPSVDVITGVIKANIPSRIAFGVSSQVDSRTILDMAGAEKLLGQGDMLFLPMGSSKPIRIQGAFLSDQEVETVVAFVREQGQAEYNDQFVPEIDDHGQQKDEPIDELYEQAIRIVLEAQQASASMLQRRMRIGYNRASRIIDMMHTQGMIGSHDGSRPREVFMTLEQYEKQNASS